MTDPLIIAEYQYLTEQKKYHLNRMYQMMVFCITSFAAIFGFIGKIPEIAVPWAFLFVLLFSTRIGYRSRSNHNMILASLYLNFYKENPKLKHHKPSFLEGDYKTSSNKKVRQIFEIGNVIIEPFSLLTITSITVSFVYSINVITLTTFKIWFVPYFFFLIFFHLLVIKFILYGYKKDVKSRIKILEAL